MGLLGDNAGALALCFSSCSKQVVLMELPHKAAAEAMVHLNVSVGQVEGPWSC